MSPCQAPYLKEPKMMKSFIQMMGFAISMLVLPTFSFAQGTLYKWTDSRGNAHYTNTPTRTDAAAVDSTLPPASSFKSPTPPPEPAKAASGEVTGTDGAQSPPTGETAEGKPAPAASDAQQEADTKPKLTPEQEQALKDSPM
jgi:Domain of unknown function (DUF4124)